MKRIIKHSFGGHMVELDFTIKRLAKLEIELGFSLFNLMNFLSVNAHGLQFDWVIKMLASGADMTYDEAADILQEAFDKGESYESIFTPISEALRASGFMQGDSEDVKKKTM